MKLLHKSALIILILSLGLPAFSEEIRYNGSYNYTLRERTDLRQYNNGKYIGLVSREVTSFITPTGYNRGYEYEGSFFVQQDTMRAKQAVGPGISDSIPSAFKIDDDGNLTMKIDHGYPSFRSFPTFTKNQIKIGDSWTGKAVRAVDPLNKGIVTKMPIYVQYTYIKDEVFHDEPVFLLTAKWATRYGMGSGSSELDWAGDKDLQKATGTHSATIYVSKISGNALVVRDTVDETYQYADGNIVQFKGTIALFTEYPPSVNKEKLIPALKRLAELSDEDSNQLAAASGSGNADLESTATIPAISLEDAAKARRDTLAKRVTSYMENNKNPANNKNQIAIDATPAGIRLSIQNLQFKANSSELMAGEASRLDQIAEVLNSVPEARLLVEGHTASTGNPNGEMELSIERAKSIASELAKRGVDKGRFICKGQGGTKPIADNGTTEGKARNRRVEITILD